MFGTDNSHESPGQMTPPSIPSELNPLLDQTKETTHTPESKDILSRHPSKHIRTP